ncbi:MAG: DUF4388 domain-containing protein [Myxococcota bacterium]
MPTDDEQDLGAPVLVRALSVLSRGSHSGSLLIESEQGSGSLRLSRGQVVAVSLVHEPSLLGTLLRENGSFDPERYHRSGPRSPRQAIGGWLVAERVASEGAVSAALRRQLAIRLSCMFAWPRLQLSFDGESSLLPIAEAPSTAELILRAARLRARRVRSELRCRRFGGAPLAITRTGRQVLSAAPLWPHEIRMRELLHVGELSAKELLAAVGSTAAARRSLYAFWAAGLVRGPLVAGRALSTLLTKKLTLRRGGSDETLLGVRTHTRTRPDPTETRRAYRALASTIHPDRFQGLRSPAIVRASEEVLVAMNAAQGRLSE